MIRMTPAQIAAVLDAEVLGGDVDGEVTGVVIDSRSVREGDCFVAIVGPRDDGHRYLPEALASGARMILIQRPEVLQHLANPRNAAILEVSDTTLGLQRLARYVRDVVDPLVIAITGSVGKTTTKTLTHALVRDSIHTHATPGNYNNQWGLPLSLLGLEQEHRCMIAELGMSAGGEIAELTELASPQIGVITNVAPVHMENFDNLAGVAAAKRELAEGLPADGTLVVNADDPSTDAMGDDLGRRVARVIRYGLGERADVRATAIERHGLGWRFDLRFPHESVEVELPLPGEHSIMNFLAAAAVAHALAIGASEVAARAAALGLPAMRGQVHRVGNDITLIDDSYNSSPAAMMRALDTLAELGGEGRTVLATGDMLELGAWAEDAHREVGLHAAQLGVALIFTVGPLARDVGHGARAGGLSADAIHSFSTSDEAAAVIVDLVRPGDTVLVKGSRGVRMELVSQALLRVASDAQED